MPQHVYVTPNVVASGTNWAGAKTGGLKAVLDNLATQNPVKANPTTTAAVASQATPSSLSAGLYYFSYSFVDPFGETLAGGRSTQFNLATPGSNCPRVTLPALPTGVQSINLYISPTPGAAAGAEVLYATGITTTTFDCTYPQLADAPNGVPTQNSTGWPDDFNSLYMMTNGSPETLLRGMNQYVSTLLSGAAVAESEARRKLIRFTGVLKAWYLVMNEFSSLAWTNFGTYSVPVPASSGVGMATPKRTLA